MKVSVILDSGAFSAWNKRKTIPLEAYCDFCLRWLEHVDYVVSLDVIPGEFGKKHLSDLEVEASASQGWNNYLYMLDRGIPRDKLIHVYHQGEKLQWLKKIVSEVPYIGLSPANDRTTPEKVEFLDSCMPHVTNHKGFPIVKFHGFAVTSHLLMTRYPWASVDSTSWVQVSRHGRVFIPQKIREHYDYIRKPFLITVSERSPGIKIRGKHYDTLGESMRLEIDHYLNSLGISMAELKTEYRKRDFVNLQFLNGLQKQLDATQPRMFRGKTETLEI